MQKLKIVAVASSEETRSGLLSQLQSLEYVDFEGVMLELSDAAAKVQQARPDVVIIDMTGREMDSGLFMQTINMDPNHLCTLFALHRELDHQTIVDAVKYGAKEFIQYPEEREKLELSLKKYLAILNRGIEMDLPRESGKLMAVFAAKGGSGASTTAANLAYEVHQLTRQPTVLLDLDQVFCNSTLMFNVRPTYSVGDLVSTNPSDVDEELLRRICVAHDSGVHIVAASKNVLDDHEMISPELLERTLDYLVNHYSYVIVDLPTHVLDPYHQYVIERSKEILLVSELDIPGLSRTRQYLELARRYLDMDKVKLVLNRWTRKAAYGMSNESVEEQFSYPVYCRIPNDWDLCVEANSVGSLVSSTRDSSDLAKSYRELAAKLTGLYRADMAEDEDEKGSILARLFGSGKKDVKKDKGTES